MSCSAGFPPPTRDPPSGEPPSGDGPDTGQQNCSNGGTYDAARLRCICPEGWTGPSCADGELF